MAVSGVLTQKPDSPVPTEGEVRRFTVEQKPKKNKEGTWNKLKNERGDFGSPYKVLKAERIDDYNHPQHGTFHQFSVLIDPVSEDAGAGASSGQTPVEGGASAPATSDERAEQINRSVAFKGACEVAASELQKGVLQPEQVAERIQTLTAHLLPVVEGEEERATDPPQPKTGGGAGPDPDIPFA